MKTEQHRLKEAPVFQTSKEIQFKSICIFTLRGSFVKGSEEYYMFENNKQLYEFGINGKIQDIEISADSILISINKTKPISPKSLVEKIKRAAK